MDDLWVSVAVLAAYVLGVGCVLMRQVYLDRRRARRAAERRLLAFKAWNDRKNLNWDDLLREGEPSDDEIYEPSYLSVRLAPYTMRDAV